MTDPEKLPSAALTRVLDAVVAITSDLDLESVLRQIVTSAMDLTGARYGALGVLDGDRLGRFIPLGLDDAQISAIPHWPHGDGLLGEIIRSPHPVRVANVDADPRSAGYPAGHPHMHTFLGVPIRVRESVFGNLYLTEKADGEPFSRKDEAAVVALAAAAGAAIDNARLYGQAKQIGLLEDRDRIARDLHDVVIQRLFASAMTLMSVQPSVTDETARARIEEIVTDLDETIQQIRSTIFSLHTATDPDAPSIDSRLQAAAHAATTTLGFAPRVVVAVNDGAGTPGTEATLPATVADQLVVVLGESLTNVARHASATAVDVRLEVSPSNACLTVTDNGIGIKTGPGAGPRSGLRNLEVRAQDLGGESECSALPDGGTRLTWRVPLSQ